jgi:hypothetical protein
MKRLTKKKKIKEKTNLIKRENKKNKKKGKNKEEN